MRLVRGLAATIVIAAAVFAAPWLLLQLGQLPGFLPSWSALSTLLLTPDNGRFLLVLVWAAAWVLWLWTTAIILTETVGALRGIKPPSLPGGSFAQPAIRILVMAAIGTLAATAAPTPSVAAPPIPVANPAAPIAAQLARPQDAKPAPEAATVTVERGDSLWSLSEEHLEDPQRWPELYELNRGIEQHTGYALEDPDFIDVGWILKLPTRQVEGPPEPLPVPTEPVPTPNRTGDNIPSCRQDPKTPPAPPPRVISTPEAASPSAEASPTASPALSRSAAQLSDSLASSSDDSDTDAAFDWQVAGLIGAGSFLGAGLASLLARRRREQFRTRRPGRTIAVAEPHIAPIEMTAHIAAGLSARLVNRLDAVLRRLHGTLEIKAAVVSREGTIHLITDNMLQAPWVREPDGWSLPNSVPADHVGPEIRDSPCAYPLLVTIGADSADRVVLINLETLGHVTLTGDEVMRADFTRYLAAELAVNPWSAGVRVSCHGPAADAVPMAPERLDADDAELLTLAQRNQLRATRSGHTTRQGRATQAEDEMWGAGAILTPREHHSETTDFVAAHPGSTGVALVTGSRDHGTLNLTGSGRVTGLGMELTAVGLTEDEAAGCAVLLNTTTQDDLPPQPADDLTDITGNLLAEHRAVRTDDIAIATLLPEPDEAYLAATATTHDDLAVLAPCVNAGAVEQLESRDPTLDDDARAWFSDRCPYPRLSLLGPVKARCYGKPMAKQKAYYTEALSYLALHPHGVTGEQIANAFGLSVPRARTVLSNLRQWVGTNPRTREPHIPDAKSSPEAKNRGVGLYLVQDLLVDVDLFRRLRARALSAGPDGIGDLEMALTLVDGRPFDQLRPAGWTWLLEGDRIDHHMVCAIGDVAHILVTHHLHAGRFEAARQAANIALQADPDSETARLDLAVIMVETGHSEMARQTVADALGEDADLDLTPRGLEVSRRRQWLSSSS
ncbi:tetratricopeptide repeat protein [Tessaracoccus sp. MC1756]|uniref:tetratricopeptide repeat protein n=1 Tax=Tessaracoccus sp. MC1756 TaxID=2760311 RepID=UPI0016027FD1|nr:tetratricopeptide repeat protein [Tessaracoccus sp. MC1756]MBB1510972.1 tetratricopeptide repeat protein [Tessaracoccus sp. MC1756]